MADDKNENTISPVAEVLIPAITVAVLNGAVLLPSLLWASVFTLIRIHIGMAIVNVIFAVLLVLGAASKVFPCGRMVLMTIGVELFAFAWLYTQIAIQASAAV